jgi:CDGSH-type Zn-finger protein/truncated hemoglobin YjbI
MTGATNEDHVMIDNNTAGRGALAQVIATRGGRAAPETPFVIEHREALVYMLCEAAELEHAIMCQYLYAAFSLKQSTDEGLSTPELEVVERWRQTVSHIATQEMLHLTLVQNLLSAIGAAPHFSRPNLPQPAGHYPPGVVLTLLPFGEAALRHFMFLERPEGMDLADAPGLAAVERAAPVMLADEIVPRLQDFATVGHLYRSVEEGLKHLCAKYGESWLFVGPPGAQASEAHFGWSQLVHVTDGQSAQRAIDTILEQGEGPRGHWRRAHFGAFVDILDEYQQLKKINPEFEPARPVLPATVRRGEGDNSTQLISDAFTARCTDLFNVSYEILLQTLARYFAHTEETEPQLAALAQVSLGLMFNVIKPLGQLVTTLPVGVDAPGRNAGPSFELFYESDYLLPHRDAAWALIEERIREAAAFADRVRSEGPPELMTGLAPIGPALLSLGHTLATCRSEWGGRSHAGEVTVAHRRQDARRLRANPAVVEATDRLASALRRALAVEQSLAWRALFAAASLAAGPTRDGVNEAGAQRARAWKRGLVAEADRRFDHTVDLADLLVGVLGDTEIEPPGMSDSSTSGDAALSLETLKWLAEDGPAELADAYAEITGCLFAVPSEALLVDPHPAPTFALEEQRQPLPGVVDQSSALALVQQLSTSPTGEKTTDRRSPALTPSLSEIAGQLREAASTRDGPRGTVASAVDSLVSSRAVTKADPTIQVAGIFRDSHDALLAVLSRSVSDEQDVVAARHRHRDIAARLHNRVLRPLAEALTLLTADPTSALGAAYRSSRSTGFATLEERLQGLAGAATRSRVELAEPVPPGLLEATAGLQDIAVTFAVTSDVDATALREQFRMAEAGLPPSIQLTPNGPYLLSNVDQITDGLGETIPTRPQIALCRCGESAAKPWCDGSHARADFTDEKDPNRVVDRSDSYAGLAITVLDNRGICQHSGYCSDRVPVAFRVDQEPFVAPSGARMDEIIRAVRNCPSGALSFAIDGREARDQVDWHLQRTAAVMVTNDGPYRVTGGIPLIDATGSPVPRNQGSSQEHYALCRCGHSQNKPFCSGMHWYIQFRDPVPDPARRPTLYEWCGGLPALARATRLFFERGVPTDSLLAPLFAEAPADYPERVARWLGEGLGGPRPDDDPHRDDVQLLGPYLDHSLTEPQRARWVSLFCRSAQDAGLPADPQFWSAFTSYLEWESRAVFQQSPTGSPPRADWPDRWDWGPAGSPPSPATAIQEPEAEATWPGADEAVSFARHIRQLFRPQDRQSMAFAFDLWSYEAVKENASAIIDRLRAGTMPCDGPWPPEKTDLFQRWISDDTPP